MTAAGWYPDPADPRRERWWDGAAWSGETREPGAAAAEPPAGSPSAPPAEDRPAWPTPAPPSEADRQRWEAARALAAPGGDGRGGTSSGRRAWPLVAVAVAVVLVLVVGGVVLARTLGGDDDPPDADPSTSPSTSPSTTSSGSGGLAPPVGFDAADPQPDDRICLGGDPYAGERHDTEKGEMAGGGLLMPIPAGFRALGATTPYPFAEDVEPRLMDLGGNYAAVIALGAVPTETTDDLQLLAEQVVLCTIYSKDLYDAPDERTLGESEETTVAGWPAWSADATVAFATANGRTPGGDVQAIVVDTGDDDTVGLFLGIVTLGDEQDLADRQAAVDSITLEQ